MNWAAKFLLFLSAVIALVSAIPVTGSAQGVEQLSQVRKLYVDSMGTDKGAAEMREQLVRRLRRSREVQLVSDPKNADAVLRGTGRIWVTGQVALEPRSHSLNHPTFEGFLSAELTGRNGETLWSYLVSPSNFAWNGIADDLARQLVGKLLFALKAKDHSESAAAPAPTEQIEGTLKGAGTTFAAPLYQRWFELFQEQYPNVHVGYDSVGSGEGIRRVIEGQVDFGASEMPLSDQAMAEAHQHFAHVPTTLGAVVVIYNLQGLKQTLNFTPATLSGIYLGKIKKWNDPEIRNSNRGVELPDASIVVVHRSDGSGTTFVWTDYLSKISPEWKASVGSGATVSWPVGIGAGQNEGVASAVQHTPNSIGYVEFIYALQHELSFGTVQNADRQFIKASISSVTAAAAASGEATGGDFRQSITNPHGRDAYPIASYTWLLIPERKQDPNKKKVLTDLLRWMLTTGQKKCSGLGYAPLPAEVANRALDSFDTAK